ncbi:MAG: hypothetical protein ACI4RN_04865 [Oscillospiraceae bacterium]
MKGFFSNVWVKRSVSVFCIIYVVLMGFISFATFLYHLSFNENTEAMFFTVYTLLNLIFLGLMILTRHEFLTRFLSMIFPIIVFMLVVFNMGNWVLIVPPFIVALVMFFFASNNETLKVVVGTIYLLIYVVGIVAVVLCNILFATTSVETELTTNLDPQTSVYKIYEGSMDKIAQVTAPENTISPDGKYRFYICDVKDSDKGAVKIYVVPYGQDIQLGFFTLEQKGIRKTISSKGQRGVVPDVGWTIKTDDSGNQTLAIQYRMSEGGKLKETSVNERNMPRKQYLEFLGLN